MTLPIREITIDARKLDKSLFFEGKPHATKTMVVNGQTVPYRPLYCILAIFENKDGASEYGDDAYVVQGATKKDRDAGKKGGTVGNSRVPGRKAIATTTPPPPANDLPDDDSVPF